MYYKSQKNLLIALAVSGSLILSGCTIDPYTGEQKTSNTVKGTAGGALIGAGIGAMSSSKKDRRKGLLIGAAGGALVGANIGNYMDAQEAKLREKLRSTGVSVTRDGDNITLNMPNNVTFATNSSTLKPDGVNTLSGVAMVLKEYNKTAIYIIGHTDNSGNDKINIPLSIERAESVASNLIMQGVSSNRISFDGVGSKQPIASNATASGRAENRRVQVILTPMQ